MTELHLPRIIGVRPEGWLASLGLARILFDRYPDLTIRWDNQWGHLILDHGPTDIDDVAATVHATVPPDGAVLPGVDPGHPPRDARPGEALTAAWTGPDAATWQHAMIGPLGDLHPLIAPHAAQTLGRMLSKIVTALRTQPDLIHQALTGLGMTEDYGAGLWILRRDAKPPAASPARDWLAVLAIPWMPVHETTADDGTPAVSAVGWQVTDRSQRPELAWSLWVDPMPAADIPAHLQACTLDPAPQHAWTRRRTSRQEPAMLRPVDTGIPRLPGRPPVGGDDGAQRVHLLLPRRLLADLDRIAEANGDRRSDVIREMLVSGVHLWMARDES